MCRWRFSRCNGRRVGADHLSAHLSGHFWWATPAALRQHPASHPGCLRYQTGPSGEPGAEAGCGSAPGLLRTSSTPRIPSNFSSRPVLTTQYRLYYRGPGILTLGTSGKPGCPFPPHTHTPAAPGSPGKLRGPGEAPACPPAPGRSRRRGCGSGTG